MSYKNDLKVMIDLINIIQNNIDKKFNLCCFEESAEEDETISYRCNINIYIKDVINKNILRLLTHKLKDRLLIFIYMNDNPVIIQHIKLNKNSDFNENDLKEFLFSFKDYVNEI